MCVLPLPHAEEIFSSPLFVPMFQEAPHNGVGSPPGQPPQHRHSHQGHQQGGGMGVRALSAGRRGQLSAVQSFDTAQLLWRGLRLKVGMPAWCGMEPGATSG